jgi:hypothetical protein
MSAARQKSRHRLALLGLVLGALCAFVGQSRSSPSGPVVTDPQTGIAIGGLDPVAYFTDRRPTLGLPEHEYRFAGVTWRFRSEANRDAFADHPDVYMPQFGGYDPVAVARGVSVPGNPLTWAVAGDRLYLFYDAGARAEFAASPRRAIEAAQRHWPEVLRTLP